MLYLVSFLVICTALAAYILLSSPIQRDSAKDRGARWAWAAPPAAMAMTVVTLIVMAAWVIPAMGYGWDADKPQSVDNMMGSVFAAVTFVPLLLGSLLGARSWRRTRRTSTLVIVVFDAFAAAVIAAFLLVLFLDSIGWLVVAVPLTLVLLGIDYLAAGPARPAQQPAVVLPTSASQPQDRHDVRG